MRELVYIGSVKDGAIKITDRKGFESDMQAFEGKRFIMRVKEYRKSRSLRQNRFYWGNFMQSQIDCFKERWGYSYSKDQVHNWNKANFWAEEHIDETSGEVVKLPASSTNFSTVEWELKLDVIRTWFHNTMEWELPVPLQQSEINYDE